MSKESLYAFLARNIAEGRLNFSLVATHKRYSVEFSIFPNPQFYHSTEDANVYDVSPDPDHEEFDFLFNLETVPEPDAEKFRQLLKRANMREGLDGQGREIQLPVD
jgi:hypothetical protein